MSQQDIEFAFPSLPAQGYAVTSPATADYNCIAWAANNSSTWWWPDPLYLYFWPSDVPRVETLDAFIKAYESLGYSLCQSSDYEEGWEKIALYVDANGKPTHAARQLTTDYWTSKLGRLEDIEHKGLDGLSGSQYGSVSVIMRRHLQR